MLDREQLARVVHDAINRMEDFDTVGEELLHVQPWTTLDDRQREYCARIGEAVARAILTNDRTISMPLPGSIVLLPGRSDLHEEST